MAQAKLAGAAVASILNGVPLPVGCLDPLKAKPSSIMPKLWLWKNFVDGRPEYWAFDNPYPCHPNGDPMTLGEPCGYAIFKQSTQGRTDVSEAEIIAAIKRALHSPQLPPENVQTLDDGFGNQWEKCGKDCGLEIVRPGKVQCNNDRCVFNRGDMNNGER